MKSCNECICNKCLYRWSGRCPHGECYDHYRAENNPYDKAHPNMPPRTGWSSWKTDQAYWCRGGVFYPAEACEHFVSYEGLQVKECLKANISVFQDNYIQCSIIDSIGCEACYKEFENKVNNNP